MAATQPRITAVEPPARHETDTPLLECRGISKRFGAVQALTGVDFEIHGGEVVALVGDNGAGKSTLIKAISGIQPPDEGTFLFDGREVRIRSPRDATALGIATVYQDLALCDNLDTVANLFLGRELGGSRFAPAALRGVDEITMERRAHEQLDSLGVTTIESVHEPVGALSGGQRQAVAVARATLTGDERVVILDEPTAALGVNQTAQVLALVRHLRDSGLGVVVISHNIDVVFAVADRIVVLYMGSLAACFEQAATTPEEVISAIIGVAHEPVSRGPASGPGSPGSRPSTAAR